MGRQKSVTFSKGCIAGAGPNNPGAGNSRWCVTPELCAKNGYAAHEYPEGITAEDIEVRTLSVTELEEVKRSWKQVVPAQPAIRESKAEAPNPPWRLSAGPNNGDARYVSPNAKPNPEDTGKGKGRGAGEGRGRGRKRKERFEGQLGTHGEPSGALPCPAHSC